MTSVRLSFRSSSDSIRSQSGKGDRPLDEELVQAGRDDEQDGPDQEDIDDRDRVRDQRLGRGGRHVTSPDQVEDDGRDAQQAEDLEGGRRRERAEHGEDDQESAGSQDVTDHGLPIVPEPTDPPRGVARPARDAGTVRRGHVSARAGVAWRRRIPHRSGSPCRAGSPMPPTGRATTRWAYRPATPCRPSRPRTLPPAPAAVSDPGEGGVAGGWRTRSPDGSTPTSRQNCSTLGWYASRVDRPRPEGPGGRTHPGDRGLLIWVDLETMTTDRAGEVLVRAVRHQRDEVQADVLVGSDVMEEDLVVAVRARRGRDLAEILRLSRSPAEDQDQSTPSRTTIRLCAIEERIARRPETVWSCCRGAFGFATGPRAPSAR